LPDVKSFENFLKNNEHQFNEDVQQQAKYRQNLAEVWQNYTRQAQECFAKNSS